MSAEEKKHLIDQLTETHHATHKLLDNVDLEMIVYTDTGWRIRDILGHIATWDHEVAKSLRAYREGSEYIIPDLDEEEVEYNSKAVEEQRTLSNQQIVAELEKSNHALLQALQDIPDDQFPGDFLYPWDEERGSIATLVEYMIEHSDEHREEIIKALQGN